MPEVGQSSYAVEDEVFIDIPVDSEQLVGYAPTAPVQTESEDEEDDRAGAVEPVRGGVSRSYSEDDEDELEEPDEVDSDEHAEEVEPAGYHDGMGTTADDIIEELTTRSVQLEDRVAHLEEQNGVHQERENQYRDLAYQREDEVRELKRQLEQSEVRSEGLQTERDGLQTQLTEMTAEFDREIADKIRIEEAWVDAARRVDALERTVRGYAAMTDRFDYALDTAFDRLRHRIRRYPREEGTSRRTVRRRVVDRIAQQEHDDAIYRTMRG